MIGSVLARHVPRAPVAFGAKGTRSASQLRRDQCRVAEALGPAPHDPPFALLVFREDRYAFTASLLGALSAGYPVLLSADTDRDTVLELSQRDDTGPVLHDTLSGAPLRVDRLLETAPSDPVAEAPVVGDGARLRLSSRSADGALTSVDRTWTSLLHEADTVGAALGLSPTSRAVGSVPPGHPYGLVAGVLAPLLWGGAFLREHASGPRELAAALREQPEGVWLSVPAQLASLDGDLQEACPTLTRIVTSTAPLPRARRVQLEQSLGVPLGELVGDACSGLCLWRARARDPLLPLDGVEAHVDPADQLRVDAPWLEATSPCQQQVRQNDDGGFESLGSPSDWLEVGGQRLPRIELEAALCHHPAVTDAALWAPRAGPFAGQLLAAVVAPSLSETALSAWVHEALPPQVRPARLLSLDSVARDALGALRSEALLRRFSLRPNGAAINLDVEWDTPDERAEGDACEYRARARVPHDYAYFEGHFPGYPILPGAAQLGELVLPSVRRARPELGDLRQMTRLKFLGRITPGATVEVLLRWKPNDPAVDFSLESAGQTCAAGRLGFAPSEAP